MKKMMAGLQSMCRPARLVLYWALGLSCSILAAALALIWVGTPFSLDTYWLFFRAAYLEQLVRVILFFAVFVSAVLEEHRRT